MSQAQLLSTDHFSPSVSLIEGRPATTSLAVANLFKKQHQHVMRSIEDLCINTPESFSASNFGRADFTDEQGKPRRMFILYRDGFMLLVMGYTGTKALAVKLAYIEAFNRLEAELAAQREAGLPHVPHIQITPSTPASRKPLRSLVNAWARLSGQHQETLWPQVKAHFQLERIDDLPEEWIPDAITWVQGKIDALPQALPAPKPVRVPLLSLTPEELAALDRAAQRVEELNRHVLKEISALHGDIFECVDSSRMPFSAWNVLSDYIYYSLERAACLPSGCLEGRKNPALGVKMLAGALDER